MKGIRNGKRALDKKSKRSMDTHIVADPDLLIKSKSKKNYNMEVNFYERIIYH